jgi:2-succinyl-6-hydroxy-2,4-cyclohexadiene-1-carboxylate synthase
MLIRKIGIDQNVVPTLYLHGFLGDGLDWRDVAQKNAIIVDLPSSNIDTEILHAIPKEPCNLVGYSMGGRIAMRLKTLYPDRFAKTVIISAHPGLEKEEQKKRWEIDCEKAKKIVKIGLHQFLTSWYNSDIFSSLREKESFPELLERRKNQCGKKMAKLLLEESIAKQKPFWNHLQGMHFLYGELDSKYRQVHTRVKQSGAITEIIKGCGHALHLEDPRLCRTKLENILYGQPT